MKRRGNSFRHALHLALALALAAAAGTAHAQAPSDKGAAAEALFREARALVEKKDFAAACPKFKASYELDPGYGVLWNLADCYASLGKTASAWVAFTDAATMATRADQKDRVQKAEKRAAELAPKLEKMTVTVTDPPAGLVVKRDDVPLDSATWGVALPVDPGKHTFSAEAPGKKPWSTTAETKGPGTSVTVTVPALEAAPVASASPTGAPSTAPTTGPAADDGRGTRRVIGLVVGGAGVAALAVGAVMGGLASSKWSDAQNNHCRTDTLCDDTGVALVGDAKTFATVSTATFIAGGVLAAGGATLFILSLGDGKKKEGAGLQILPSAGPRSGALFLRGAF